MGNPTINVGEAVYQSIITIIQIRANKIKINVCFYLKGKLVLHVKAKFCKLVRISLQEGYSHAFNASL